MKKIILISTFLTSFFVLKAQNNDPLNVILLIGDGMGLAQVHAMMSVRDNTALEQFQYVGLSKTASADNFTTDSGAGGTALSTGKKTNNGYIALDPQTKQPMETLIEKAVKNGISTGVVVNCDVTHATPADFLAHNINRNNQEDIALDEMRSNVDVLIGGGKKRFENRKDGLNLSDSLRIRNYNVVYTFEEMKKVKSGKLVALFYDEHPPKIVDGRGNFTTQGVKKALELLSQNKKGFFLMIEGSQIDFACHNQDMHYLADELADFESNIAAALAFAKENENTLVIVTADHETGGLAILNKGKNGDTPLSFHFANDYHTSVMVPVFAFGPKAELFAGIYENAEVANKIKKVLFGE